MINSNSNSGANLISDLSDKPLQSSNDCFVRFFSFFRRDTRDHINRRPTFVRREKNGGGIRHGVQIELGNQVKSANMIDVASDILSCSVSKSKSSASGSFSILLSPGDINYHHVLHPGDHVMIWMRRNRVDHIDKNNLISKDYNNNVDSGFKMYGVITDVRRKFKTIQDGRKILRYEISGQDIGYFFESQIYYTAFLANFLSKQGVLLSSIFDSDSVKLIPSISGLSSQGLTRVNTIIPLIVGLYLGLGPPENLKSVAPEPGIALQVSGPNDRLTLPSGINTFFNSSGTTLADVLRLRVGVEEYKNDVEPKTKPMEGWKIFTIEAGNQQSVWEILRSYANTSINEIFIDLKPTHLLKRDVSISPSGQKTTYEKIDLNTYKLFPTLVCRQIPFTSSIASKAFDGVNNTISLNGESLSMVSTTFLELPRIKIPESFIINEDIGRGEHERFNFLEIVGAYPVFKSWDITTQEQMGNWCIDSGSIQRYGLRSLIAKTDYQWKSPEDEAKNLDILLITKWIYLLADWWLGAHTFETGTFQTVGIEEAISLGDNIEIARKDGVNELYHIEAYQHDYGIDGSSGTGIFRTTIQVSRGQRIDEYPVYASGQFDEESELNTGLTDTEFEGTARPSNSSTSDQTQTSSKESPLDPKKVNN